MSTIHIAESATIDAPPEQVYAVIADYRNHHPHILPKPYFVCLEVTKGGTGEGTEFVTDMNVYGAKRTYRMTVTEPQRGSVLAERDPAAGTYTTFSVEPLAGGAKSKVTITTDAKTRAGLGGWLESLTTPMIMRKIYRAELQQLNDYIKRLG